MRIISVANQKGGSGKTTTSVNFAASLAAKGRRTLLVDFDPQANATSSLCDLTLVDTTRSLGSLLLGEKKINEVIYDTPYLRHLHFIPSTIELSLTELDLTHDNMGGTLFKQRIDAMKSFLESSFDYIVCDCPPNFGVMTTNALHASSDILVPMEPETFAFYGLEMFMSNIIDRIRRRVNSEIKVLGIVLVRVNPNRSLTANIRFDLQTRYKNVLLNTEIPVDVKLPESVADHVPANIYAKSSRSALAYDELTGELLGRLE